MINGLQAARAIAALSVVLLHASISANFVSDNEMVVWAFGHIGVDFFFVLSGFIIFWVHIDDPKNRYALKEYLIKRFVRIYPPFLPISLFLLIVYALYPRVSYSDDISILTSLFLIPSAGKPALNVAWTLIHEMFFYLTFALIYISGVKILTYLFFLWAVVILFKPLFPGDSHYIVDFLLSPHNLQFLFGMLVAYTYKKKGAYKLTFYLGAVLVFLYIQNYGVFLHYETLMTLYLGFAFSLLIYGLCSVDVNIKYPKMLLYLGSASYSIYLIHNPAISLVNRGFSKLGLYQLIPVEAIWLMLAAASVTFGCVYYFVWEKPILRMAGRSLAD